MRSRTFLRQLANPLDRMEHTDPQYSLDFGDSADSDTYATGLLPPNCVTDTRNCEHLK